MTSIHGRPERHRQNGKHVVDGIPDARVGDLELRVAAGQPPGYKLGDGLDRPEEPILIREMPGAVDPDGRE